MERILIIGANGQLGSELTEALREKWGSENVLATDIREAKEQAGRFQRLDALDRPAIFDLVKREGFTQIYLLAAVLSATGEKNPHFAWKLNMDSLFNVLEVARELNVSKVYWPSSIAVFGPDTPKHQVPQQTICNPTTVYGISKLAGEQWCEYYHRKFGVDVRSIRYPGLIGYKALPGGGTTDYAVDIYHQALEEKTYECFLAPATYLPMMYMDDAVRATIELMDAPAEQLKVRTSYNLNGMSFAPEEIASAIKQHIPEFTIEYAPDFRQHIADSWPDSIDDHQARQDWGWKASFDLSRMTELMLSQLKKLKNSATAV